MKRFLESLIIALSLFLFGVVVANAAPTLEWNAVTNGTDGLPLGPGLEIKEYRVYRCGPSASTCTKASATFVGPVAAPATSLDLVGLPVPQTYFVTAFNIAGESVESVLLKVVPPDVPKNPHLK